MERCWHLNARQPGDVRMRSASGLSWSGVRGRGAFLVSDLIRGLLLAKSKASEVSAEHTQLHREIKGPDGYDTVCLSCKRKKKKSRGDCSRSCSSGERQSS